MCGTKVLRLNLIFDYIIIMQLLYAKIVATPIIIYLKWLHCDSYIHHQCVISSLNYPVSSDPWLYALCDSNLAPGFPDQT